MVNKSSIIILCISILIALQNSAVAQQYPSNVFRIQFKPVISGNLLDDPIKSIHVDAVEYSIERLFGHSVGMVFRRDYTKKFSVESGINFIKRRYEVKLEGENFINQSIFGIVSYEIPLTA